MEAAITAEKQEADLLKAQIADLKATREAQAQEQPLPVNTKYNDVLQWYVVFLSFVFCVYIHTFFFLNTNNPTTILTNSNI